MSKYLHQYCSPKLMTRFDMNDKNQSSKRLVLGDITIPSPYFFTVLSETYLHKVNKIFKIFKNMQVFFPHSILMFPCHVLRTVPGPLDLYKPYGYISKMIALPVQYAHRMHLQGTFLLHLNHIPINHMITISYILLE
jgi:hypothetical protein